MINNILKKIEKANEVQNVDLSKHEVKLATIQTNIKELGLIVDKSKKVINEAEINIKTLSTSINAVVINENAYKELLKQKQEIKDLGLPSYAELEFAIENFETIKEVIGNTKGAMKKAIELIANAKKGYDI